MIIAFSKSKRKEYFNGIEYPIGTSFINIYNQMSNLTNNKNFILDSYKNIEFYKYQQKIIKSMFLEKTLNIKLNDNHYSKLNINEIIEIENIKLDYKEFKELVFFIILLDEFITLTKKDKRLNTAERFLYFFTIINNYHIPKEIIEDSELLEKYNNLYTNILEKKHDLYQTDQYYFNILECDKTILREIGKTQNIIYKYDCKNFIELLLVSYLYMIEENLNLKQCKYCSRFFIANNGNQEYCDKIRPQRITETVEDYQTKKISCREFNKKYPSITQSNKIKEIERKIKLRIQKRIRSGDDTNEYLKEWENSIEDARKRLFSNELYIKWLENESDTHQRRRKKNGSTRNNKK